MRSNDLYLGTPYNFIQFTTLQEVMAGWLDLELGNYLQVSDSLHLYQVSLAEFSIGEPVPAPNTDSLALPKPDFDRILPVLGHTMDSLRNPSLKQHGLTDLLHVPGLPEGWRNVLHIVGADTARRRGWQDEADTIAAACTNPALTEAWLAWQGRMGGRKSQTIE